MRLCAFVSVHNREEQKCVGRTKQGQMLYHAYVINGTAITTIGVKFHVKEVSNNDHPGEDGQFINVHVHDLSQGY